MSDKDRIHEILDLALLARKTSQGHPLLDRQVLSLEQALRVAEIVLTHHQLCKSFDSPGGTSPGGTVEMKIPEKLATEKSVTEKKGGAA